MKFAGIRELKGEKKSCSYAYVKAYGGGRGVKKQTGCLEESISS